RKSPRHAYILVTWPIQPAPCTQRASAEDQISPHQESRPARSGSAAVVSDAPHVSTHTSLTSPPWANESRLCNSDSARHLERCAQLTPEDPRARPTHAAFP